MTTGRAFCRGSSVMRRGWYLGKETFNDRLLKLFEPAAGNAPSGRSRSGGALRDHGEEEGFRIVQEGMKALGAPSGKAALAGLGKSDRRKIVVAGILRTKTSVSNEWIATRLAMGHPGSVSRLLSAGRADKDLAVNRDAMTRILFPDEKSNP